MNLRIAFSIVGLTLMAATASAQAPDQAIEPKPYPRLGPVVFATPLVPDGETAKRIFRAIEERAGRTADIEGFPLVTAKDDGDGWVVWRGKPLSEIHFFGGGQLQLKIAKCNAAILDATFTR